MLEDLPNPLSLLNELEDITFRHFLDLCARTNIVHTLLGCNRFNQRRHITWSLFILKREGFLFGAYVRDSNTGLMAR